MLHNIHHFCFLSSLSTGLNDYLNVSHWLPLSALSWSHRFSLPYLCFLLFFTFSFHISLFAIISSILFMLTFALYPFLLPLSLSLLSFPSSLSSLGPIFLDLQRRKWGRPPISSHFRGQVALFLCVPIGRLLFFMCHHSPKQTRLLLLIKYQGEHSLAWGGGG